MHQQLLTLPIGLALVIGAGSPLPYGQRLVAPALLLSGVHDEPSDERLRVLGTVASKGHHAVSPLADEPATVQRGSTPQLLAVGAAALTRLAWAAWGPASVVLVPLRC